MVDYIFFFFFFEKWSWNSWELEKGLIRYASMHSDCCNEKRDSFSVSREIDHEYIAIILVFRSDSFDIKRNSWQVNYKTDEEEETFR